MQVQRTNNQQSFTAKAFYRARLPENIQELLHPDTLLTKKFFVSQSNLFLFRRPTEDIITSLIKKAEQGKIVVGARNVMPTDGFSHSMFFTSDNGDTLELAIGKKSDDCWASSMVTIKSGDGEKEGETMICRDDDNYGDDLYDGLAASLMKLYSKWKNPKKKV